MIVLIDTDTNTIITNGASLMSENLTLADYFERYEGTTEYNGIVKMIQEWYYGYVAKTPWCTTAVSFFAFLMGNKVYAQIGKHENVDVLKDSLIAQGRFDATAAYGGGLYKPKRGDLIFFSDGHNIQDCTHVGVVQKIDFATGEVTWIGGNTGNAIACRKNNFLTDPYVTGWGNITYDNI